MSKEVKSKTKNEIVPSPKRTKGSKSPKELKINLNQIHLVRDQEAHAKSLIEILKKSVVAFDMSMMGAGKTYVASEVAIRYNFKHIVVVCPASVMGKWESMKRFIKPQDAKRQDSKSLGVGSNSLELNSSSSIFILSYEGLRSTTPRIMSASGKNPKRLLSHGLLYRSDPNPFGSIKLLERSSKKLEGEEQSSEDSKTTFYPSEELISMIKEGCLFIFDEAQKVKNKNASWLAVKTISETILGRGPLGITTFGPKSRFLMLSGTPMDKEEHAVNLMEMMGFIQSRKLFTTGMSPVLEKERDKSENFKKDILPGLPKVGKISNPIGNTFGVKLIGAQELIDFCKNINKEKTERIVRVLSNTQNFGLKDGSVREGVIHLCYTLFQEIIKKEITSSMVPPKPFDSVSGKEITLDAKNGYYKFSDSLSDMEAEKELTAGLHTLDRMMKTAAFRPGGSIPKAKVGGEDLGNTFLNKFGLTKPLKQIETGKVPIFIRKAKETLKLVPNSKVCIFVNYLESLANIAKALAEYNPILMYGSVPKEKRQAIIDLFQEPNLKYRVYISILSVSATGIDLDDQSVGCNLVKGTKGSKESDRGSKKHGTLVLRDGCFPRYAFASPGFKIDELHQLTRRFYRVNTKSNAVFRFVYAKGHNEVGLLNNLARKSGVMKDTLEKQVESGVKFPGEYSNEIESFIA